MNIVRQRKYEFLVKKLFIKLAKITLGDRYKKVKLKISYDEHNFVNTFYWDEQKIILQYYSIAKRIKKGYDNSYYEKRHEKIDKIIHNNRRNSIRFILLHELKHSLQLLENKEQNELQADDYAIKILQSMII